VFEDPEPVYRTWPNRVDKKAVSSPDADEAEGGGTDRWYTGMNRGAEERPHTSFNTLSMSGWVLWLLRLSSTDY
jgi:hypothetical protein